MSRALFGFVFAAIGTFLTYKYITDQFENPILRLMSSVVCGCLTGLLLAFVDDRLERAKKSLRETREMNNDLELITSAWLDDFRASQKRGEPMTHWCMCLKRLPAGVDGNDPRVQGALDEIGAACRADENFPYPRFAKELRL